MHITEERFNTVLDGFKVYADLREEKIAEQEKVIIAQDLKIGELQRLADNRMELLKQADDRLQLWDDKCTNQYKDYKNELDQLNREIGRKNEKIIELNKLDRFFEMLCAEYDKTGFHFKESELTVEVLDLIGKNFNRICVFPEHLEHQTKYCRFIFVSRVTGQMLSRSNTSLK